VSRADKDPRPRAVLADVLDRMSIPRFYSGDWAADQADRLLDALYDAGYDVMLVRLPGKFPESGPR
jgi:hypothetical protein